MVPLRPSVLGCSFYTSSPTLTTVVHTSHNLTHNPLQPIQLPLLTVNFLFPLLPMYVLQGVIFSSPDQSALTSTKPLDAGIRHPSGLTAVFLMVLIHSELGHTQEHCHAALPNPNGNSLPSSASCVLCFSE